MPLDAICLAAVKDELDRQITGSKIDKIQQPERDVLVLSLRGASGQQRLLISAGSDARIHLTEHRFDNPSSPPMFCMLLRKHLTGARITGITQIRAERQLDVSFEGSDALGDMAEKHLIIELIGRKPNIILTDGSRVIVDCLRRCGGDLSDKRMVLPGLIYRPPAAQEGKLNPFDAGVDAWQALFDETYDRFSGKTTDAWLLAHFTALSPFICREISWRAYGETCYRMDAVSDCGQSLRQEFFMLPGINGVVGYEPWTVGAPDDARASEFSYIRPLQYEGLLTAKKWQSFSSMLDSFFTQATQLERFRQRAAATVKTVKTTRDRFIRKLSVQHAELKNTEDRDRLRECGDIITANLHLMEKGQSELLAEDFYAEDGSKRCITLDRLKTPQQNAAKYYKDYTRAKNAGKYLSEQIKLGEAELTYLESVLEELTLATDEHDLSDIRRELVMTGYIKEQKQGKVKPPPESAPLHFISSSGLRITAGRNNIQNDRLTLKTAFKSDVWLHAQKIHGSHVIISCEGAAPDGTTLREAADIAAYYSAARNAGKVPVDYTMVRNVRKPAGARPGMVVYTDYKTIIASPGARINPS